VPLSMAHKIVCDAPKCRAQELSPHATAARARTHFGKLGWTLIRWRRPHRGLYRRAPWALVIVRKDNGGSGKILTMCPKHRAWRPARGVELPLPKIPTFGGGR